jgi:hypothetical protein
MPWKTCQNPDCDNLSGPRALKCKACGEPFPSTLRAFGHLPPIDSQRNRNNVVVNNTINITRGNKNRVVSSPSIDIDELDDFEIDDTDDYIGRTPILPVEDSIINIDPTGYFDHLFDREDQINILVSATRTAIDSDFQIRTHIILHGPPAGGKTSLSTAFIEMVGEEHCYRIDATTSTQAGIISDLFENRQPGSVKFIVIDEIEKCDKEYLRWLLGVMDDRAELRVNNTRVGSLQMPLAALVIATTNNIQLIEGMMGGALASRFTEKVYCPRVRDQTIHKAVMQKLKMLRGVDINEASAWADKAIEYVRDVEGTDDIRRMIAVAVNGRERLLTGEFQAILQKASNK